MTSEDSMKERPILFSGAMVRALLAGTKTQTRRVVKARKCPDFGCDFTPGEIAGDDHPARFCPYGQPGDRLWVREAWRVRGGREYEYMKDPKSVMFRATHEEDGLPLGWESYRWRPSIHMPRWASRITLEVTGVRVERLQDIGEKDAWAEGCEGYDDDVTGGKSGYSEFHDLWEQINGPGSWDRNPWVWVVEFKRMDNQ